MDGVKIASSSRGMMAVAERQCVKDGERVVSPGAISHFCIALHSFRLPSCTLVDYHLSTGGILLHDAVEVNCKSATTENQGAGAL